MAKIIVYNNSTDRMETYYRGESQSMPYNTNGTLLVREFRGASIVQHYGQQKTQCFHGIHKGIYLVLQYL